MNLRVLLSASATAALLSASAGLATTFTIDSGTVSVSGVDLCAPGDCVLTGVVQQTSFPLNNVGDSLHIGDLFDWSIAATSPWATGGGIYNINAVLNFSAPSSASATGSGYAGFATFLGTVSAGVLKWTSGTGTVDFAEGYKLSYSLDDAAKIGFGTGASTGGTFTLDQDVAPVPLPATALLLMAGVGALGGIGANRRRAA